MARHFDRKLRVYCAVGSATATVLAAASLSEAQVYKSYFSHDVGGNDSGSIDASDANGQSFLFIGDDSVDANHQTGTDGNTHTGAHLYVTNNKATNKANYLYTGNAGSGALANLPLGSIIGSSNTPSGTMFENNLNGTDNDIAYTDSTSGTIFTPQVNVGSTASQYSLLTTGYFGFSFQPTNSSTLDYGYAQVIFDASGDITGNLVYNTTGAAVTVAPFQVSNWIATAPGDLANSANWINGVPGGVDYEADFGNFSSNSGSVNVSNAVTLGIVRFYNKNVNYTLSGTGSLNLNSSTGNALIAAEQGMETINLPVNFLSFGALNVSGGSSSAFNGLTLNGSLNFSNGGMIHVGTAGALTVTGPTNVASGKTLSVIIDGFYGQPYGAITLSTVNISSGATAAFSYNYPAGADVIAISNLILGDNSTATLSALNNGSGSQGKLVLQLGGVSLAPTSKIDLQANDLDILNNPSLTSLTSVTALVAKGYNGGKWNGSGGINSSTVAADSTHLTALGVIENTTDGSTPLYGGAMGQFDNQNPGATDVLVRYTYYGDANLDGQVDGSDYSLIDNGFASKLTGWFNGDFNYDGVVDGSDYTLIDNAFNNQQANLVSTPAGPAATIATQIGGTAVPEPASLSLIAMGAVGLLRRKRL